MKPNSILFFNHTSTVSGAERVLLGLLKQLRNESCKILLVCPKGDLARESADLGIPPIPIPELRARFTRNPLVLLKYMASCARVVVRLRTMLRAEKPDIVHANSVRAGVIASLACVGLNSVVIWHVHDILPHHLITTVIRLIARASRKNSIVAVSAAAANSFRGNQPQQTVNTLPVVVIHNGVDAEVFRNDPDARLAVRKELGIREGVFVVGIVGQITHRKGQLELVRAFASVARALPNAILLVVGAPMFHEKDRQYYDEIEKLRIKSGLGNKVHLLGKRADVPAVLNAVDVVVVNSTHEPFALVVLEALASSKPVIATAVDGICEVIESKVTGILVEPGNTAQLSEEICSLASNLNLRLGLGENGRRLVGSNFTVKRQAEKFMALYERSAHTTTAFQAEVALGYRITDR